MRLIIVIIVLIFMAVVVKDIELSINANTNRIIQAIQSVKLEKSIPVDSLKMDSINIYLNED